VAFFAAAAWSLKLKSPEETKGILLLDAITFPKLVPSKTHYVVVQVTNKHTIGDYGTDSIRADYMSFAQFAQDKGESQDILFAQVIVNGAENQHLAKRIGVKDGFRFPSLFIFPIGSSEAVQYPEKKPYHPHDLTRFLSQHTNFYYHIPGTSKTFDQLSKEFIKTFDSLERAVLLTKAKEELSKITDVGDKEDMTYYVKIMEKVMEKGDAVIQSEIDRITKIIDNSKLSKEQRNGLKSHLSVLKQFAVSKEAVTVTATMTETGETNA
jgi:protein disulfide-isomerase A6